MKKGILLLTAALFLVSCVMANTFVTDTFTDKDGHDIVITFIKHGSLKIEYRENHIYIDPVSEYADYSDFPKADIIIVTHEHADHLDKRAIADLEKTRTLLITSQSSFDIIGKGVVMKNGDKAKLSDYIAFEAVPAYNITPGREMYHPRYRDNGFILILGGVRIYVAGDTEDIPEMENLKDIDIAFLPVNQPYTMTVDQAARAAQMFSPKILYPYHYGDTNIQELADKLRDSGIEVRIRKM